MANRWIVGKVNPSIHCKLVESLQNHPQMMFTELFQPTLQFSVRLFGSCKSCMLCFFIFSDFQPREMTFWYSKLSTPLHGESVGKALTGRCRGPDHPSDQCPPSWLYHSWHFRLVKMSSTPGVVHFIGCHMMGISSHAYLQNEVQNLQNLSEQMTVSGLPDKSRGVLSPSTEVEMAGFKKA